MLITGQFKIGSSLFVVLYASCTLWTALLSRVMLENKLDDNVVDNDGNVGGGGGKRAKNGRSPLSLLQWLALIAITLALAGDALISLYKEGSHNNNSTDSTGTRIDVIGILTV